MLNPIFFDEDDLSNVQQSLVGVSIPFYHYPRLHLIEEIQTCFPFSEH